MIRLMLADGQSLFLEGLRQAAADWPDVDVVCCASCEEEVLDAYGQARPDVVLMEVRLAPGSGLGATAALTAAHPDACVVMLTASEAEGDLVASIGAGARGYLLKDASPAELHAALRLAASGESPLSGRMARRCVEWMRRHAARSPLPDAEADGAERQTDAWPERTGFAAEATETAVEMPTSAPGVRRGARDGLECRPIDTLTQREQEILVLLAEGLSNQQIAGKLFISEKTVKKHLNSVFAKLDVANRSQAAVYAIRAGLC